MSRFYREEKLVVEQERPLAGSTVAASPGFNYNWATGYLAHKHSYCMEILFQDFFNCLTTFFFLTKTCPT